MTSKAIFDAGTSVGTKGFFRLQLPAAWRQQWAGHQAQASAWWKSREPRERKLLSVCGTFLALTVVWLFGLDPALARLSHWQAELPRLQALAADVDVELRQAAAVRRPVAAQDGRRMPDAIARSLDDAGMKGLYEIAPVDGKAAARQDWSVTLHGVSAQNLVPWLLDAPVALGMPLTGATLERLDVQRPTPPGLTVVARESGPAPAPATTASKDTDSSTPAAHERGRFSGTVVFGAAGSK